MNIYSKNHHRRIYESHFGPIPKDHEGRSYEIHHIDGNHSNNEITNLKCVSIQEHYNIHYQQGDWAACLIMARRMSLSANEISELSRKTQLKRLAEGKHHFKPGDGSLPLGALMVMRGDHPFLDRDNARKRNLKRVNDGSHNFLGEANPMFEKLKNGTHHFQINNPSSAKSKDGTHHFFHNHPNKVQLTCPHCHMTGGAVNMKRYHFENCKLLKKI